MQKCSRYNRPFRDTYWSVKDEICFLLSLCSFSGRKTCSIGFGPFPVVVLVSSRVYLWNKPEFPRLKQISMKTQSQELGTNSHSSIIRAVPVFSLSNCEAGESEMQGRARLQRARCTADLAGDHDGNVSETMKLIAKDKRSTWICAIDMIPGSLCLTCEFNYFIVVSTWTSFWEITTVVLLE